MTTKRDRAAAAAFFNDQPQWDLVIAHWIETGEKRYGMGTVRPNVLVLADAFAAHAAIVDDFNRTVASIVKQQPYETADLYDHPSQALKAMCDLIEDLQARAPKPAPTNNRAAGV